MDPLLSESTPRVLRRSLTLWHVVLYGLGTTIGAGIYLLIGEVARVAGTAAPAAFLLSLLLAAATALSFGELVSRYPQSAGEAAYVREGFGRPHLSLTVGLLVAAAGCISSAVMTRGFVGYLTEVTDVPEALCMALFIVALVGVAIWGIGESVTLAGVLTIVEVGGLLAVVAVTGDSLSEIPERLPELFAVSDLTVWPGVAAGALLAFYSFLGFEDMVNVAEEVKDAQRTLPIAIVITLCVTGVLYLTLASVCVLVVTPDALAASPAPLALVYEHASGREPTGILIIGILAVVNGALIQLIMSSRVLYGLASRQQLPSLLARVHSRTQTPHVATIAVGGLALVLAWAIPLAPLAEATSVVTLIVFAIVNTALLRIKRRSGAPRPDFEVSKWIPCLGACTTSGLLAYRMWTALIH